MLNNLMSNYLFDTLEPIAKWISIGVIGTMIISLIVKIRPKMRTETMITSHSML